MDLIGRLWSEDVLVWLVIGLLILGAILWAADAWLARVERRTYQADRAARRDRVTRGPWTGGDAT